MARQLLRNQRIAVEEFLKKPEVKCIEKDFKILNEFTMELSNLNSWTKFFEKGDQKIYYKKEEGLSSLTCFMEGMINAPMINVATILGEVELYKEWLPITPVSDIIKELTPMRKLIYIKNALQWPCWNREIIVEGGAYAIREDKAIGLSLESVRENQWFGHAIERHPENTVETHVNKGFIYIKYINDNQTQLRFFINIDIHLDLMPSALMNWGMKNICGQFFQYI